MIKKKMFAGACHIIFSLATQKRKNQTQAEEVMWNFLRKKPFNLKFRRQHPFSNYILDFYCHKIRLVIEIDGSIHNITSVKQNDEERQRQLEQSGLSVIRFSNNDLITEPEKVITNLMQLLFQKLENVNN